jgi:putative nucleotidyltransferase with HDIG domain
MNAITPFRGRLFALVFFLLGGVCLAALLLAMWTISIGWGLMAAFVPACLLCAFASWIVMHRLAKQGQQLAAAIEKRSPQEAEHQSRLLVGSIHQPTAVEWRKALHDFEKTSYDRQAEAQRNYAALTDLMSMIARAVDERTSYLRGHSDRVAAWSAQIAQEMGLDTTQIERIRLAALLHDIGTLGIEDSIVMKEAPLSPEEFDVVKAHTVKGASILRPIEALADLIPGVELHHEALDGSGYPYGLKGDEIPMMPRIIAVADSFDAMTTTRPYQSAMDPGYVLEVLSRMSGKRYDAAAVAALSALVGRGEIVVRNLRAPVSFRRRGVLSRAV